jgi:hypothetical protein
MQRCFEGYLLWIKQNQNLPQPLQLSQLPEQLRLVGQPMHFWPRFFALTI